MEQGLPFGAGVLYGLGAPLQSRTSPTGSHMDQGSLMGSYKGRGSPVGHGIPCVVPYGAGLPPPGRARGSVPRGGRSRPCRCPLASGRSRRRSARCPPGFGPVSLGIQGSVPRDSGGVPRDLGRSPPSLGPVPPGLGPVPPPRPPRHFPGRALSVRRA